MTTNTKRKDFKGCEAQNNVLQTAREYIRRGWSPVPIPRREKGPQLTGWPELRLTEDEAHIYFLEGSNVGLLLGEPSHGLVDIDLDASMAASVALIFLPPTNMVHGRSSKAGSHLWYVARPVPAPKKFTDVDGTCLLELRSTAQQTVVPPSIHPSGEIIVWEQNGEPASVDGDALRTSVARIAACVIAARHWPSRGRRDEIAMALAGWLLRSGWKEQEAIQFISAVARLAGDEQWHDRIATYGSTAKRLSDQRPTTGMPRVSEIVGDAVSERLQDWLSLTSGDANVAGSRVAKPSQSTRLVALSANVRFFCTPDGNPYATFPTGLHLETWSLKSLAFRHYLIRKFYESEVNVPGSQSVKDALGVLWAKAQFDGDRRPVWVRVAEHEANLYLDLGDANWRAVEIGGNGWRIIENPPVHFRRPRGLLPLPEPMAGGSITELRSFLNLPGDDDWALALAWTVAVLRPRGPYPILTVHGEQGSTKSTTMRALRSLVDPYKAPLRSAPRDERDLVIAANNSHVIALDNLSHLESWLSDALCRLSTGGGLATRELYTDDEETIFESQRPIMINGINDLGTNGDFLERSMPVYLPEMPEWNRREEREYWESFCAARPRILGALLDAASAALRNISSVKLPNKPRMADFAVWAVAAEPALKLGQGAFMRAYAGSQNVAHDIALESSVVASEIRSFLERETEWSGTAGELLERLNSLVQESTRRQRLWPKTARALSGVLRRLAPNLRAVGVLVIFLTREPGTGRRLIRLEHRECSPSPSSQPSGSVRANSAPENLPSRPVREPSHGIHSNEGICDGSDASDGASDFPGRPVH